MSMKLDKNSIENIVCKPMEKAKKHEMTEEDTKFFIRLSLSNNKVNIIPSKKKPFIIQVMEKRIDVIHSYSISDERLIVFLATICETPGMVNMYLWYLQYWCSTNNKFEIDLEVFGMSIFPFGFPSKEDMDKIWANQKLKNDSNLIDKVRYGESILPKTKVNQ